MIKKEREAGKDKVNFSSTVQYAREQSSQSHGSKDGNDRRVHLEKNASAAGLATITSLAFRVKGWGIASAGPLPT